MAIASRLRLLLLPALASTVLGLPSAGLRADGGAPAKSVADEVAPYEQDDSLEIIAMPEGAATQEYLKLSPKAKAAYLDYFDSETQDINVTPSFMLAGGAVVLGVWSYLHYTQQATQDASSKTSQDNVSSDNNLALVGGLGFALMAAWGVFDGVTNLHSIHNRDRASKALREQIQGAGEGLDWELRPMLAEGPSGANPGVRPAPGLTLSVKF
jgi:hypothetical protein